MSWLIATASPREANATEIAAAKPSRMYIARSTRKPQLVTAGGSIAMARRDYGAGGPVANDSFIETKMTHRQAVLNDTPPSRAWSVTTNLQEELEWQTQQVEVALKRGTLAIPEDAPQS